MNWTFVTISIFVKSDISKKYLININEYVK